MSAGPTLQRLERVLLMVPWLLEHPGVSVDEVAERFGVPAKEVVRDLDILGYCGLPGYGGGDLIEASIVGDRVSVRMADYFRRPLALSLREGLTLLLAGSALAGVEDLPESAALASAVKKLRDALGAHAQLAIDLTAVGDEHLAPLRSAVRERRAVELVYRSGSKAETTRRTVEPWAVIGGGGSWYLHGWCRLAQAPRHFRLDRMKELRVTDEVVHRQPPEQPPQPARYTPSDTDETVVLALRPAARWLADWVVADEIVEQGNTLQLTFRTPSLEWVARTLLRVGADATVVQPDTLRERVSLLVDQALARYA